MLAGGGLVVFLLAQGLHTPAIVAGVLVVLAVVLLALAHSALSGIYSAMLYRYAVAGNAPAGFDGALLRDAFTQKN